ncbi:MAG: hypothetical protein H6605_01375 [Flavobacteriales bacterium]|nr:hypothetical protein [Flavobacteriales bacterium]
MINYFELFDLPVKFNIDESELKRKYQTFIKDQHPDFFVHDDQKHREALEKSSLNNLAYDILRSFYKRCAYLLSLFEAGNNKDLPPDFLMEMMEINEQLEDLKVSKNDEEIRLMEVQVKKLSDSLEEELIQLTQIADRNELSDPDDLKRVSQALLKHKYVLRLQETLSNFASL